MLKNYLKIALRFMLRQRGFSIINIAGLTIGITCSLLIILYIQDELSYDKFHVDAERIHRLGFKGVLEGKKIKYQCPIHEFNRKGEAIGELVGGNLALLAHLVGSDSDLKTKGRILFIEDVGEYLYNIDRMLYQLKRTGKLDKLAGLIIGGFSDIKDTERPFGQTVHEIIRDVVAEYDLFSSRHDHVVVVRGRCCYWFVWVGLSRC